MFHFKRIALLAALLAMLSPSIQAEPPAQDRLAVLPVVVTGSTPASFPKSTAARDLQMMISFLTEMQKDYPVLSPADQRLSSISQVFFGQNDGPKIAGICRQTESSLLLSANIQFSGATINGQITSVSCLSRQVLRSDEFVTNLAGLQSQLSESIRMLTPQLRNHTFQRIKTRHPVYVIDTSGSMAADLVTIRAALDSMASANRNFSIIKVADGRIHLSGPNATASAKREFIRSLLPYGDVSAQDLFTGIQKASELTGKNANPEVIIISDAVLTSRNSNRVESSLRRLKRQGIQINLLYAQSASYETRKEIERLSRAMQLPDGTVLRGRRMGFLDGSHRYFIQEGNTFYLTDRNVNAAIESGRLDTASLKKAPSIQMDAADLTFDSFPRRYAKLENKKLTNLGPIHSSLEKKLRSTERQNESHGRVLLKNGSQSFWIDVADARTFQRLRSAKQSYVALRFDSGDLGPVNLPDSVYIVAEDRVPAPMVQSYSSLMQMRNRLNPQDIWLLQVQVIDSKN